LAKHLKPNSSGTLVDDGFVKALKDAIVDGRVFFEDVSKVLNYTFPNYGKTICNEYNNMEGTNTVD
jgi:hypothetical protein